MNNKFFILIRALLPYTYNNAITSEHDHYKLCENCYYFVKKQIKLMSSFYRVPIYLLIQLFFFIVLSFLALDSLNDYLLKNKKV